MKKFWELLEESVIVQAFVTALLTLTICGLLGIPMIVQIVRPDQFIVVDTPKELWALVGLVYGYYFGTKKDIAHKKELSEQAALIEKLMLELAKRTEAETVHTCGCSASQIAKEG